MSKMSTKRRLTGGLRLLGRGPEWECVLSYTTLDLLIEKGFARCCSDGEWRLTPAGSGALKLVSGRRA